MGQGKSITQQQIDAIRAAWILTESGTEAARQAGCAVSTANAYIRGHLPELRQLRYENAPSLSDVLRSLAFRLVSAAFDGRKIEQATLAQVMTGAGIAIDKLQLVSGEATSRNETIEPTRLTPEQMEQAAAIRERFSREAAPV